jgi:hypothetical protein
MGEPLCRPNCEGHERVGVSIKQVHLGLCGRASTDQGGGKRRSVIAKNNPNAQDRKYDCSCRENGSEHVTSLALSEVGEHCVDHACRFGRDNVSPIEKGRSCGAAQREQALLVARRYGVQNVNGAAREVSN